MKGNSFCSFRWSDHLVDLGKSEVHSCCKTPSVPVTREQLEKQGPEIFENSDYMVKRRQEMLDGVRHSDCNYCWNLEEKGAFHTREKSRSQEKYFRDFASGQVSARSPGTKILEVKLESTCQMKCLYCSPKFSTSWQSDYEILRRSLEFLPVAESSGGSEHFVETKQLFRKEFFKFLPRALETVEEINFIGGEPLIQQDLFEILEEVIRLKKPGSHELQIFLVTNLSVPGKQFQRVLEIVSRLPENVVVHLSPSIEDTGERAEYVRRGLKWKTFKENLDMALESGLFRHIRFINTVNALSVCGLQNFVQYVHDLNEKNKDVTFGIVPNAVMYPGFLSPYTLPAEMSIYVGIALKMLKDYRPFTRKDNDEFVQFLEKLQAALVAKQGATGEDVELQNQLGRYLEAVDALGNTDFRKIFPENYKCFSRI